MNKYKYNLLVICFTSILGNLVINAQPSNYRILKCGYSKNLAVAIKMEDGKAAIEILMQEMIRENSRSEKAETVILESPQHLLQEIKNGLDMAIILTPEYWAVRKKSNLYPQIIPVNGDSIQEKGFLLTRKSDAIINIEQLNGKKIVISGGMERDYSLMQIWLTCEVGKLKNVNPQKFLANSYRVSSGSSAVMDLFFKKADAALVTQSNYETMNELNPQISQQLQITAQSKPLVFAIILFTEKLMNHPDFNLIRKKILGMEETKSGRNYLRTFKVSKMIPFNEIYMKNTHNQLEEYDRIKTK